MRRDRSDCAVTQGWARGGRGEGLKRAAAAALLAAGVLGTSALGQAVNPVNIGGEELQLAQALGPDMKAPKPGEAPKPPIAPVPPPPPVITEVPAATKPAITLQPTTAPSTEPAPAAVEATPAAPAATEAAASAPAVDDGKPYDCTGIKVDYKNPHPQHPPIEELLNTPIKLGVNGDGYVAPRPGVQTTTIKLGEIGKAGPQKIYRSGIAAIYSQIVKFYNARSIIGVFVVVDAADIDANDNDIRPADRKTLQFIVVTSTVKQVRTVAIGEYSDANRVDNPKHELIREHSPLKAATEGQHGDTAKDLLMKDQLDEYVLRLNRQQGRRVDVAVSGTGEPGGVTLDYLVSEAKPWYAYAQVSNTGTSQTNVWRERVGFVDNQLTGHDDVLSLDYSTAGFESQSVLASYELPFFNLDRVRTRAYTSWNTYTASDVGQSAEQFTGNQWTGGGELLWNFYQKRELFADVVSGLRFDSIESTNTTGDTQGHGNYMEPYLSLRMERTTDIASTTASATVVYYITNDSEESLQLLGRSDVSKEPVVVQYEASQSAYLEPLLFPTEFANGSSTLAHELYFGARGQYAFGNRLIPQIEDVAGGLYSVRGYPESIVAGDSVIIATAEYRFHLPRIFAIQSDPTKTPFLWDKSFRFSPQTPYGHPDWDLIFRGFIDAAYVVNSDAQPGIETNSTLVGTGVGIELLYKQNFNIRCDWGVALKDLTQPDPTNNVSAGSNRFHISATFLY